MQTHLKWHFEPKKGWINDPNGLVFFKGRYHAFFQHNPFAAKWDTMHWGHAVSDDLIHWEELPIALFPDQPYENDVGCFSGSAIVHEDRLYLFYTSVSHEMKQTQSLAWSDDGIHFEKYEGNPIIPLSPSGDNTDFRDPKVTRINDRFYMVCGTGKDGRGQVVLYSSEDLFHWTYENVLIEGAEYGPVIECPDFFPLGDRYVLLFSMMVDHPYRTLILTGDFDGHTFTPYQEQASEAGPAFYAPQTFLDDKGRRILIAWMFQWGQEVPPDAEYAGAFTIPRELTLQNEKVLCYPVEEAHDLLQPTDEYVQIEDDMLVLCNSKGVFARHPLPPGAEISILRDLHTVEVFVNRGEFSATFWI